MLKMRNKAIWGKWGLCKDSTDRYSSKRNSKHTHKKRYEWKKKGSNYKERQYIHEKVNIHKKNVYTQKRQ